MAYTNIDDPSAYFTTTLWTGSGSSPRAITNDANSGNFQPDFVWTKGRNEAYEHQLYDSSRGTGESKGLTSNDTSVEGYVGRYGYLSSFDSNGFTGTAGSASSIAYFNASSKTYVAWQWKANGGTTSSNTDGSITSTVQANTDAGFSIVTYTAPSSSGNFTAGHGLGVKPAMVITKSRSATGGWWTWHKDLGQPNYYVGLHTSVAQAFEANIWGAGFDTSTIGLNVAASSQASQTYVAYCFAEKQGYSKFGKYVGNGSSDFNGPFVYTGFAPRFVMIKRTDGANDWILHDYKLGTLASTGSEKGNVGNVNSAALRANENSAIDDWGSIDMLSNGFKARSDAASVNASGGTYIYMAFAEHPFTTSTGIPTTAR